MKKIHSNNLATGKKATTRNNSQSVDGISVTVLYNRGLSHNVSHHTMGGGGVSSVPKSQVIMLHFVCSLVRFHDLVILSFNVVGVSTVLDSTTG